MRWRGEATLRDMEEPAASINVCELMYIAHCKRHTEHPCSLEEATESMDQHGIVVDGLFPRSQYTRHFI